jgi:hypothetical protein
MLANDSDGGDGGALTIATVGNLSCDAGTGQAVAINADNVSVDFTAPNAVATCTFDYTISDTFSTSNTATVTVDVVLAGLGHYPPVCGDDAYQRGSDTPTVASGGMTMGGFGDSDKTIWATTSPNTSGHTVKADWDQDAGTRTLTWNAGSSRYDVNFTSWLTSGGNVVIWTEDAADEFGVISVECYAGP